MPVLPIGNSERQPWDTDGVNVFIVMAFPREEEERRLAMARYHEFTIGHLHNLALAGKATGLPPEKAGRYLGALLGDLLEPHGGFGTLAGAPSADYLVDRAKSSIWPASIVGDMLQYLLQMRASGIPPSVTKSIAIAQEALNTSSNAAAQPGGRTERYIRQAWERFKPVCHLWAAFRVGCPPGSDETWSPATNLPGFLALSESILSAALTLQARGRKERLLPAREMWRVPRGYPLPPATITIPPLADWMRAALLSFKSLRD